MGEETRLIACSRDDLLPGVHGEGGVGQRICARVWRESRVVPEMRGGDGSGTNRALGGHLLRVLLLGERRPVDGLLLWRGRGLVVGRIEVRGMVEMCGLLRICGLLRVCGIEGLGYVGMFVMDHGALVLWRTSIGMFGGLTVHRSSLEGPTGARGATTGGVVVTVGEEQASR